MNPGPELCAAAELMIEFAGMRGLSHPGNAQRRYLWTDAIAECNFLGLYLKTNEQSTNPASLRYFLHN